MQRKPDISVANKELNWNPVISRAEGINITYNWFKSISKEELNKQEHRNFLEYIK